jgi:hypothetical protein
MFNKFFAGIVISFGLAIAGCQSPNVAKPAPSTSPSASASTSPSPSTATSSLVTEKGKTADQASNGFFAEVVKYQGKATDFGTENFESQPVVTSIGNADAIFIPKNAEQKDILKSTRMESKAPDQYKSISEKFAYWAISKTYGFEEAEKGVIGLFPTGKLEAWKNKLDIPEVVVDTTELKLGEIYYSASMNFFKKKMDVTIVVKAAKVFDLKVNGYPMYISIGENKKTFENLPWGDVEYEVSDGKIKLNKEMVNKVTIKGPTLIDAIKSTGPLPKNAQK